MTEVVTTLITRADGSIPVLDQFEQKMEAAGKATDRTQGAVASFELRMAKARAAMEAGNAVATESIARRSAEQRAFDNLASSVDKSYGLRIRLEREAERASASAANAVNMGYISQEQALSTLMALERRHAAQLGQAAAANDNLAASYRSSAAAADEAAAASMRANAARMRSGGGANQAHTTNLLFQAQDIAMMTAMGQSPMMLAMQQGMQVGGIFHQIGSGRQIVQALGGAVVGLLNPLNLATIATIALGSAGVQWFMSTFNSAEDATTALERHSAMLDKVLAGYDEARSAAGDILSGGQKAPEASVVSDLSIFRVDAMERYEETLARVRDEQVAWQDEINLMAQQSAPAELTAQMQRVLDIVTEVGLSSDTTMGQLNGLHATLTLVKNSGADDAVVATAEALLLMIENARAGRVEVDSLGGALDALDRDIQIRISVSQVFSDAMSDINSLYMDPRSRFEQAREELNLRAQAAQQSAQTMSELTALASDYERVMASIDAAEAEANERANSKSAKAAQKPFDQWAGNVDQFQQRIASQRLEIDLLGKSTFEIERQKAAFDLLNQAKQAGIPITSEVTDQINLMSREYATATVELQAMQERQRLASEQMDFYRGTFASFMSDFRRDLMNGTSLWGSFANAASKALDSIADRAMTMAANGIFDMIFGAVMGGLGGGFGTIGIGGVGMPSGGFIPGLTGPRLFSAGGYTGDMPTSAAAGIVHGQEYVLNASATRRIGLSTLNAMNSGQMPAANQNGGGEISGNVYVTIERIEASSHEGGVAAANGFQAGMRQWKESGEGARYIRGVMSSPGRSNPR